MYPEENDNLVKIYKPNHILEAGTGVWVEMIQELWRFRELIWRLFVRDISVRYKQSVFGIFWAFIAPLIMMLIFVWVKSKNLLPVGETEIPYAAFVFIGQMVWLLFSQGILTSATSMVDAGNMLAKINFPKEVLVFSAIGQAIFEFLIRIPFMLIIFWWVGFMPNVSIILIPFALVPLVLMILGLGFLVALMNAITRDTSNILRILMNIGMFATPVIYPPPQIWPISFIVNTANPVSGFVNAVRDLMISGSLHDPLSYYISTLVSVLVFVVGWRIFHLIEPKIAERI